MKSLTRFSLATSLAFVLLVTGFTSCSKSNDVNNSNPNNPNFWNDGTLSAKIEGNSWTAKSVYAVDSSNMIMIVAGNDNFGSTNYPFFLIAFPDNVTQGATVTFNATQNSLFQYIENSSTAYWAEPAFGGSGSVTISKLNKGSKTIEGTFTAVMKSAGTSSNTKNVTNGSFSVKYR